MPTTFTTQTAQDLRTPYSHAAAVTPADGADLTDWARGIWVGGAGNLRVTTVGGETVTFSGVPAGTMLDVMVKRVLATSTTATLIVAVW